MRSGQQYKRIRGRGSSSNGNGNFNRKNLNPLVRNYDSTGHEVKIRGTAQHIAERYSVLARDAMSAGDYVVAENHFQHAEHYNRIIAMAQAQIQERLERDEKENPLAKEQKEEQHISEGFGINPESPDQKEMLIGEQDIQPTIEGMAFESGSSERGKPNSNNRVRRRRSPRPRNFNSNKSIEELSDSSTTKQPCAENEGNLDNDTSV
ncbi:MAG: DUF4167 domain-containing protein [Candidatus Liberibacter ctenarytainae]|uniref:DUF4167 domain-containing protein n=1 Tax=Candidatus Liberibacter ctenarytainae TaxID=2020335 RepID=A0A937AC64_9HYPH|nr:DUF4167 domain-containing protein [Candidatus Liberibacter ctenarytainae]